MRVAIVGSNRGIGLALVEQYLSDGHQVYAFCRSASAELQKLKPTQIVEGFDVTKTDQMPSLVKESDLSDIDQLIHVAGIMKSSSLKDFNIKTIMEQFEVNAVAPVASVIAFLPVLSKNAKIGLVTSRMGSIADNSSGGAYGYRMSKTALNAAGKSLSEDLREQGKAVFLLHPGWVQTDMTDHRGPIGTTESAAGLKNIMMTKGFDETGTFWHMSGEPLPW